MMDKETLVNVMFGAGIDNHAKNVVLEAVEKAKANLSVDNLESTICFYLREIRDDGKCPCDDRRGDQKFCCLELAERIMQDLSE